MNSMDIYSDKQELGAVFTSFHDVREYMKQVLEDRLAMHTPDALNNMPTVTTVDQKVGRHTFRLYIVTTAK
jgi:hypothetical protein